jgi:5-methylcytosine-specific restriction endonuclease McrA
MAQKYVPVVLRRLVRTRAAECCEYCLVPERFTLAAHWVDHIVAEKHGGQTEEGNLALSCVLCNQRKGSDLTSIDPKRVKSFLCSILGAIAGSTISVWSGHASSP